MKKYNQSNFSRYKQDVKASQPEGKFWDEYTRDELIIKFMPLVENIARKFKDSDAANDPEKTIKSFFAKRIRGAIRRATDGNRSGMRLPEHKLNEIRNDFNEYNSELYFNSIFQSIDVDETDNNFAFQIEDNSPDPMIKEKLSNKIRDVMLKHLTTKEYHVLRLSFGINCEKLSAKQIADKLEMKGSSSYVRVSQLKKQAIDKLRKVMDYSQVTDYL